MGTEPSITGAYVDPKRFKPLIHEPVWGEVAGKSKALGFLIRTLQKLSLEATFYIETANTRYFGQAPMGECARKLRAAGQDVQLHPHPTWLNFENGAVKQDISYSADMLNILRKGAAAIMRR